MFITSVGFVVCIAVCTSQCKWQIVAWLHVSCNILFRKPSSFWAQIGLTICSVESFFGISSITVISHQPWLPPHMIMMMMACGSGRRRCGIAARWKPGGREWAFRGVQLPSIHSKMFLMFVNHHLPLLSQILRGPKMTRRKSLRCWQRIDGHPTNGIHFVILMMKEDFPSGHRHRRRHENQLSRKPKRINQIVTHRLHMILMNLGNLGNEHQCQFASTMMRMAESSCTYASSMMRNDECTVWTTWS